MIDNLDNTPEQELPPLPKGYSKIENKNTIPPLPKGYNVVKKKVDTQSTTHSQKLVSETNTGSLGGAKSSIKNFDGFSNFEVNGLKNKSQKLVVNTKLIEKLNPAVAKENNLKRYLETVKVTPENMDEVTAKTNELSNIKKANAQKSLDAHNRVLNPLWEQANKIDTAKQAKDFNDEANDNQWTDKVREGLKTVVRPFYNSLANFVTGDEDPIDFLPKKEPLKLQKQQVDNNIKEIQKNSPNYNPTEQEKFQMVKDLKYKDLADEQVAKNISKIASNIQGYTGLLNEDDAEVITSLQNKQVQKLKNASDVTKGISYQIQMLDAQAKPLQEIVNHDKKYIQSGNASEQEIADWNKKNNDLTSYYHKYEDLIAQQQKSSKENMSAEEHLHQLKLDYAPLSKFTDDVAGSFGGAIGGLSYLAGSGLNKLSDVFGNPQELKGLANGLEQGGNLLITDSKNRSASHPQYTSDDILDSHPLGWAGQIVATLLPYLASDGAVGLTANVAKSTLIKNAIFASARAGEKLNDINQEELLDPTVKYSNLQKLGSMGSNAIAELVMLHGVDRLSKVFKPSLEVMQPFEKEVFEQGREGFVKKAVNKSGNFIKEANKSGVTFATVEGIKMLSDNKILGKKVDFFSDKLLEAYKEGWILHGATSTIPAVVNTSKYLAEKIMPNQTLSEIKNNNGQIFKHQSELENKDLNSDEAQSVKNKIIDLENKNQILYTEKLNDARNFTPIQVKELLTIDQNKFAIRNKTEEIKKSNFSNDYKKSALADLKTDFNDLENRRESVFNKESNSIDLLDSKERERLINDAEENLQNRLNPNREKVLDLKPEEIEKEAVSIHLNEIKNQQKLKDAETKSAVTSEAQPETQVQKPTEAEKVEVDIPETKKRIGDLETMLASNNESIANGKGAMLQDAELVKAELNDLRNKISKEKIPNQEAKVEDVVTPEQPDNIIKIEPAQKVEFIDESLPKRDTPIDKNIRLGDNTDLQQGQVEAVQTTSNVGESKTDVEHAREQIEQGILNWDSNIYSPRIDLGMTWADIRKGQADLAKGKENTVPAKRLVEAITKAKEEGGYRYKFGTGGESARATEFVTFEDMQKTKNEYNLTDAEQKEVIDNEVQYAKEYDDYFNSLDQETQNEILDNNEKKSTEISGNTTSGESKINVSSEEKSEGTKSTEPDNAKIQETDIGNNFKRKSGVRSVLKRLRDGGNSDEINSIIDKIGLNYEVSKAEKIYANAYNFIDEVGIFEAYNAIKNGLIPQFDVQTVTYSIILDKMHKTVENELSKITDLDEINDLVKEFDSFKEKVIFEYVNRATDMGKGNAILNFIYNKNQEINYSLTKQIKNFKSINSGIVPKDIMDKFIALDKEYKEANEKIKELETFLEEAKEQQNFDNILEDINRKPEISKTKKERAEKIIKALDNFEKSILKNAYSDATLITPILIQGIKATKLAIKQGVNIAEAIEKGIEGIKLELEKLGKSFESENRFRNDLKKSLESEGVELKEPKVTVDKNGKVRVPIEMVKDYVLKGGTDLKEFSEELYKLTKEEFPDVSLRDIRESISGYGSKSNKTRNAILDNINKLKLEEKLRIQYEDLQNGISKEKNVIKKRSLSDTAIKIKNQIKALQYDLGITEQERTNRSVNYTKNRIKQLQQKIETKDYSKKEIKPIEENYELKKLKIEKNRIQEDFDYLQHEQELKNRKPKERTIDFLKDVWDSQRATRATGELSFVGAQGGFYMIDKTFSRQTIKNLIKNFKGTTSQDWKNNPVKTMLKIIKSANTADNLIEMIKSMGTANYFNDSQRLLKEDPKYDDKIKAGLRILGEDVKTQVKDDMFIGSVFLNAFKIPIDLIDRVKKKETLENIKDGKLKIESAEKGRKRTTIQGYYEKLKTGEVSDKNKKTATEIFSNANPLSTFERGNSSFMNKARSLYYDEYSAMLELQGKNIVDHIEDYKKLGSAINTITGSANLNETLTRAIGSLNFLMFSARFFAANLNLTPPISFIYLAKLGNYDGVDLTNPKTLANIRITPAQKMFLKPMLKGMVFSFGASMTLVSIINSAIDDDDEMSEEEKAEKRAYVEYDPRSTDFMQVVSGNSRTDYFGSYRNDFVLLTRLWQRETTKEGEIVSNGTRNKKGGVTESNFQIASKFLANKATPSLGLMVRNSMGKKEDFYNEKTGKVESKVMLFNEDVSFRKQIKDNMLPIYFNTVESILEEDLVLGSQLYIMQSAIGKQTSIYGGKKQTMEEDIAEYNNKSVLKSLKVKSGSDKIEKNIDKINKEIKEYNMIIYAFENNIPINQKGFKEKEIFTKEQIDKIKLDLEEAKSDLIKEQIELKKNKDK